MASERSNVTGLLTRATAGEAAAARDLLPILYEELRAVAVGYLRQERANHTLQPTALVHEAFLRLVDYENVDPADRERFCALAAHTMRQVLVDHARRHGAAKRGGNRRRITLSGIGVGSDGTPDEIDLLALEDALARLAANDERKARVVELRFFGGLSVAAVADQLGVSPTTVEGDWRFARAWLRREMSAETTE